MRKGNRMSDNRQNIIDATQRLLESHGLARLTTRDIAREAKVAEGLIYHHFKDKAELVFEVVQTMMTETKNVLQNFPLQVGKSDLLAIMEDALYTIYRTHYAGVLIIYSIFSDNKLRTRMQEILQERNIGPRSKIEGMTVFLEAEQRLGRLSAQTDPQVLARCLWLITIQLAMEDQLTGREIDEMQVRKELRDFLQTLMNGCAPRPAAPEKKQTKKNKGK